MIQLAFVIVSHYISVLIQLPLPIVAYAEPSVDITSPISGQEVPVGNLTVSGTSSDNSTTNCQVYVDRNKFAPFQKAAPTGNHDTVESEDYSNWMSHLSISNGTRNNLTASIICSGDISPQFNSSSVNVIGIAERDGRSLTSEEDVEDMGGTVFIEPENGLDDEECSGMDLEPENGPSYEEECPDTREPPIPLD